jgi:hypothetical protein
VRLRPDKSAEQMPAASLALILSEDLPIKDVLAKPPQDITSPIPTEAAASSFTGDDFVPESFVWSPVETGAALYALEGTSAFWQPTQPAPPMKLDMKSNWSTSATR